MDFERIATSVPINRTAAIVAGNGGSDDTLTPEQRRRNLAGLCSQIESALQKEKDPARRKWLGLQKLKVQQAINSLGLKTIYPVDFGKHFMDVAKEMLPPAMFRLIRDEATKRLGRE
jgi:hypothetical protein